MNIEIEEESKYLTVDITDKDTGAKVLMSHGSGIDADWHCDDKGSYWRCDNSYHCMDDGGFYVGWQDFYVTIPKKKIEDFKLHFTGGQYLANKYMLRDYLEDTIAMALVELDEEAKKKR